MYNEYKNILDRGLGAFAFSLPKPFTASQACADDTKAIDRIYAIKGRDFSKSLAVCV